MEESIRAFNACRSFAGRPFASLCYAPHSQLHFTPEGKVAVCSKSAQRILGDIRHDRILDLWRGPALAAIRQSLVQGEFPAGCGYCEGHLRRQNVRNNPLLDFENSPLHPDGSWPARLEFAFSELCNLACRHCSPGLSSVWRAKAGLPHRPPVYDDAFFAQLESFLPHVRSVSLLGGEPLLQPEVHRLCDLLRQLAAPPVVHVTTNGTVWNERVERLLADLPTDIAVSVDGATRTTFERIRSGASFDRVLANLQRFRTHARHRRGRLRLNFCLMRANWHEFVDVLLLAEQLDVEVWVTVVTIPERLSLLTLGPVALQRVVDSLRARSGELGGIRPNTATKWHATLHTLQVTAASTRHRCTRSALDQFLARGHDVLAARVASMIPAGDPDHEVALAVRVQVALRHADQQGLARLVAEVTTLPDMNVAYQLQAGGYRQLAAEAARRVAPGSADYGAALLLRTEAAIESGELEAAETLLREAAALPQPPLDILLRSAWLRYRQGRFDEGLAACDDLERALADRPSAPVHLERGLLAARANLARALGRHAEAIRDLEQLLRCDGDNPQHALFLATVRAEAEAAATAGSVPPTAADTRSLP